MAVFKGRTRGLTLSYRKCRYPAYSHSKSHSVKLSKPLKSSTPCLHKTGGSNPSKHKMKGKLNSTIKARTPFKSPLLKKARTVSPTNRLYVSMLSPISELKIRTPRKSNQPKNKLFLFCLCKRMGPILLDYRYLDGLGTTRMGFWAAVANLVVAMYGTDFVNAKRVINTKVKNQKPNPENLTLAERILLNRRKEQQQHRKDSPSGSVDISELTNNDERKTPTPEPTLEKPPRRSPLAKQDSRRTLQSEPQPGPSNTRKSETPPLPPIKNASPKPESRVESVKPESRRSNLVESRKQTPVLPPINGKESRASRNSDRASAKDDGRDEIQPPRDRREFDPNLGVGRDSEEPVSPKAETPKPSKPETPPQVVEEPKKEVQAAKAPTPKPQKAETPKPQPQKAPTPIQPKPVTPKPKTPEQPVVVPVVAAAAATQDRRSKSRSRSRSRSRKRSRSKSPPKRRSRSRRKSRRRSSSSESRSSSRRRHRRSKSRKRHRSLSYSSSPRRRRRHSSSSEGRRRHSRGRSRSRRRSFDYDFERAKSLIRSLSRVGGEFPRQRPFEQPMQPMQPMPYPMYAGNPAYPPYVNPMYWPAPHRQDSPRRKKEIIIVQDGQVSTGKRRNTSSSESDVSVIVRDGKNKGKKGKVRRVSPSESDSESERSKSMGKKKKGKRVNFVTKTSKAVEHEESEESEEDIKVEKTTKSKKVQQKKSTAKQSEVSESSEKEHKMKENIPKMVAAPTKSNKNQPVVAETQKEVFAAAPKQAPPLQTKSPNTKTSAAPKNASQQPNNTKSKKGPSKEDLELQEAIEQLDKKADFELEQLKGSNARRAPPPGVNREMQKKIFGRDFQANINAFLES